MNLPPLVGTLADLPENVKSCIEAYGKAVAAAVQEHCDPSCTVYKLAEMVLSDCGHSSNNQRLLDRVAERIQKHCDFVASAVPEVKS